MTQPIPEGYSTVTACLAPDNCAETIELYKKAFGAKENLKDRTQCPETGKIMHTVIQIGDTKIMMSDKFCCPSPEGASLRLFRIVTRPSRRRRSRAGSHDACIRYVLGRPPGRREDKCGIQWSIATHIRDVSEDDLKKAPQK